METKASGSIDEIASLLKAGVSEKILKEVYGVTEEEIQKAKKLLEMMKKGRPSSGFWRTITQLFSKQPTMKRLTRATAQQRGWMEKALLFTRKTPSFEAVN